MVWFIVQVKKVLQGVKKAKAGSFSFPHLHLPKLGSHY
jgi:hypothetical protein